MSKQSEKDMRLSYSSPVLYHIDVNLRGQISHILYLEGDCVR